MKVSWAAAIAEDLAEFRDNLGDLDPSKALANLRIWVGSSKTDPDVVAISGVLRELFETHGAVVLPKTKPQGAFDDQLVQELIKSVDFIAMLAITPGVSAEALELCNISKGHTDKMLVYMPEEYRNGYIYDLLKRKHNAKIKVFTLNRLQERREPELCRKMFYDALNAALDKHRKAKLAPHFEPRIGIITALPKEFRAVEAILGDSRPDISRKNDGYHRYLHGTISAYGGGKHQVVLALAGKGNNKASIRATQLLHAFTTVEEIFMVGIAAGVPNPGKPADHVRLGDVVVSDETGVIQFDMIKQKTSKREYVPPPRPPSPDWVRLMYDQSAAMPKIPNYFGYLDEMLEYMELVRPKKDLLNDSPWFDAHAAIRHPRDKSRTKGRPKVYQGPIGSSNTVLKAASIRNALREKFRLRAIEMEGSGIADATWEQGKSYMIVRGICDYANDGKADDWHDYAACAAAAFTRQLIEAMPLRN